MTFIKVLPDSVINQIAAGEVVERPASVVRELLDNALDAGATIISLSIVDGGRSFISISDNGCGMSKEDAYMAFERHATSKLTALSDLESIETKGFRGEALPSIASVSKMRLITKDKNSEASTIIEIAGGKILGVSAGTEPIGTAIEVRNLFFNVPARKKFLKSDKTEELKIKELVQNVSLCHPTVRFELQADNRIIFSSEPFHNRQLRAKKLFRGNTVGVKHQYDEVVIEGLLGHPSGASSDAKSCVIIVNNRLVTDKLVLRATKEAFSSTLKEREFPIGYLSIDLPGQFVDINVHPQKAEVRFSFPQKIFSAVKSAVTEAIMEFKAPSTAFPMKSNTFVQGARFQNTEKWIPRLEFGGKEVREPSAPLPYFDSNAALAIQTTDEELDQSQNYFERYSELSYIGQLFSCYLLCEHRGAFFIIDMHAAHERLNFNKVKEFRDKKASLSQKLLVPLVVEVGEGGVFRLSEQNEVLQRFGLEVDPFGESSVVVRAVPTLLQGGDIVSLVKELSVLDHIDETPAAIHTRLEYVTARIACHASVRSGRILKRDEVYALFEAMDSAAFSAACPHGRPCVIKFSEAEVERWFGRDR